MDTIFALATARGKAGVAIVRVSGPSAHHVVNDIAGDLPVPRRASLRQLRSGGTILDEAIVVVFDEGSSFTGEASAEFHLHGSPAVIAAVLRAIGEIPGLRMAEPGEFTRRALENGRLDLTQVEGLADLIDSETEAQRRQALRVLSGAIGQRTEGWRRSLIRAGALLEASIDFVEEDVPENVTGEVVTLLDGLLSDLRNEAEGVRFAERLRDGFEVAILGNPNSGKSTLFNNLAGREAAITSEIAGTTRDIIEVRMDLSGLPVTFLDTAGLRETDDPVESIGIIRAASRAKNADLRVFLLDGDEIPDLVAVESDDIMVPGKADLRHGGSGVSGLTGQGVPELLERIVRILDARLSGSLTLTRERHRVAILSAIASLEIAQNELYHGNSQLEIAAEALRQATRSLDALTGRLDVETLLGEIFSSFCIGK
jgi:tRNA modification GTPase